MKKNVESIKQNKTYKLKAFFLGVNTNFCLFKK